MSDRDRASGPEWLQPPPTEKEGLSQYAQLIRERARLIALVVGACLVAAVAYLVLLADTVYESQADILITPVASDDSSYGNLSVIRTTADPSRDVETGAQLIETPEIASRAKEILNSQETPEALLSDISAEPVAQSNIVAITAEAGSPEGAQDLANAFAQATVDQRTDQLHDEIEALIPDLETRAEAETDQTAIAEDSASNQLARLQTLLEQPDPSLRIGTEATLPSAPVAPRPVLTIAGALLAGLVLGLGLAFGTQALDPVLRREEQLRSRYRLPILTRVPREPTRGEAPLGPDRLSSPSLEAFRALRASLVATHRRVGSSNAILVTGSGPSEGKTTTAINLSASLALAGFSVILIEADLRRPSIARALDLKPESGVVSVLLEQTPLREALTPAPIFGGNLNLLLADYEGASMGELFSLPTATQLLDDAKAMADYVIIDSPPLTSVVDALPLAGPGSDVVVVVRLGVSRLDKLQELGELMAANALQPLGFAVMGAPRPSESGYYDSVAAGRRGANGSVSGSRSTITGGRASERSR